MNIPLFLETKNEYTEHLVDTLTPFIYEGLNSIYKVAYQTADESNAKDKTLLIFQKYLQGIDTWSQIKINDETERIKQKSGTTEYMDDLVRAVIKSNILLLTYSNSISDTVALAFYGALSTPNFIHRCYIECAKDFHNHPYLFYHELDQMEIKRNQLIIEQHIQGGITRAIRKILPISLILKEYLMNTVNIVCEPTKVEMVGLHRDELPPPVNNFGLPQPVQIGGISNVKVIPERKIFDSKLDSRLDPRINSKLEQMQNLIATENAKSEHDKMKSMLQMDKIISNTKPNEQTNIVVKNHKIREMPLGRLSDDESERENPHNGHLRSSDKKVLQLSKSEKTDEGSNTSKKYSATSISSNPIAKNPKNPVVVKVGAPVESERADPNKIKAYIEEYGHVDGTSKAKKKLHK